MDPRFEIVRKKLDSPQWGIKPMKNATGTLIGEGIEVQSGRRVHLMQTPDGAEYYSFDHLLWIRQPEGFTVRPLSENPTKPVSKPVWRARLAGWWARKRAALIALWWA